MSNDNDDEKEKEEEMAKKGGPSTWTDEFLDTPF
jgi:hypothetical protein